MWNLVFGAATAYFGNRSQSWWTGPNSFLGKLGIGDMDAKSDKKDKGGEVNPFLIVAIAYFWLK